MRYKRAAHTAWRTIAGQAFIVNTQTSTLHELNDVGTAVWECLKKPASLDDISRDIVAVYDVEVREARADAETFLARLASNGLIEHES